MKKITILTLVAGIITGIAFPASAQTAKSISTSMNVLNVPAFSTTEVSARALSHFKKSFSGARGEQWSVTTWGFMTRFEINGTVSRAFYDKKGNWLLTVAYYGENKLPADITAIVKDAYGDYSILTVEEIKVPNKTIYQVEIKGNKTLKTVRVSNGELDLVNDFESPQ